MTHRSTDKHRDALSEKVIGCAIEVHRQLGPGLSESAYEAALSHELSLADVEHERQVRVPVQYKGIDIDAECHLDMLIEGELVIKLKTVERIMLSHEAQLASCLKLSGHERGLILNFQGPTLKEGIKRVVLS